MTAPVQDDEFLKEARRLASGPEDEFLTEAERQAQPTVGQRIGRTARALLRETVHELVDPFGSRVGRAIAEHPADVARQGARGLAESGLATARGVEELLTPREAPETYDRFGERRPAIPKPPIRSTPVQRLTEEIRGTYGEPESTAGQVAQAGARLVGDVAQYMAPAAGLKAAGVAAPATLPGKIALNIGTGAPLDALMALSGPENSLTGAAAEITGSERLKRIAASPAQRTAVEVATGALLSGGVELAVELFQRARVAGMAARRLGQHAVAEDLDAIAAEARDLSLLKERNPAQQSRLRALSERLKASEAQLGPTTRTAEEVAQAAEPAPALPADVVERERARHPITVPERPAAVADEFDRAAQATAPISAVLPDTRPTLEHPQVQAAFRHVAERQRAGLPVVTAAEAGVQVPQSPEVVRAGLKVEPPRAPKFRKLDDAALEARYHSLLDRMQAKGQEAWEGMTPWTREDPNASGTTAAFRRSGTAVSGKAGRAIGRMKDDARIATELEAEMAARGLDHDAVLERYLARQTPTETGEAAAERAGMQVEEGSTAFNPSELGGTHPRLVRLLARAGAGGAAGGAVGSQVGDTPQERRRNALLGALAGATLAGGLPEVRGRAGRIGRGRPPLPGRTITRELSALRAEGDAVAADNLARFMEGSQVPRVVFHGDFDATAVGNRFRKGKATSGRFYFTEDPKIGSNYATGKPYLPDEASDYRTWFHIRTGPGKRDVVKDVDRAWYHLSPEQQGRVRDVLYNVGEDEATGQFVRAGHSIMSKDGVDYHLTRENHGNALATLRDIWLDSAALFDQEERFTDLLKMAGLDVTYRNPQVGAPGVGAFWLSIKRPIDATAPPADLLAAWREAAKTDRTQGRQQVGDIWHKESRSFRTWLTQVEEDLASGTQLPTWPTSIPEKATKIAQRLGYDGIVDVGGKMGGEQHRVWIAFEPNQIKSATGNRGTFSPLTSDVTGGASPTAVRALAGAGVGAAGGAALDEENRARGALIGGVAGAGLGAVGARLLPRGRAGIISAVPEVGERAAAAFGRQAPAAAEAAAQINPDDYVNVAKFALDPSGEARLRQAVTDVVAATGMHPKQRVSWTETKRMAATLGLRPQDLAQREASRLNGAEMLAIRNIVSTNLDAIEGMSARLADATISGELRERFTRAVAALEGQNASLLERFVVARSSAGRDLNNLKILANRTLDLATWLVRAQRLTGGDALLPEVRTQVLRFLHDGDRAGLVRYLTSVRRSPWYEKLTTLWKAGLLTNPKTHAVNITSNTTMAMLETAKDNPAVLYDRLMSLWTGEITKAPTSVATVAASFRGARQGAREAAAILRGGSLDDALRRFDIPRETNFDNAILDTYTKTVFRLLGAEDRIFRGAALQRSLAEQASVLASREGLRGSERAGRVAALLATPTDEMVTTAIRDAEVATFTDETDIGRGISGFFAKLKSPAVRTAAELVLPFKRTPAAVATRVFEYSPFGFVGGTADAFRVFRAAAKGKPVTALQRRAAERLGRATTGASAILVGMWLYEKGLATGAAPTFSTREREQWRTEGKQPNSVLIGGKWRNIGRLSPLGNVIALGANLRAALMTKGEQTVGERVAELAASTVRTVADQPFVTGLRSATEAVLDPQEQAARFGTNLAGSVVPAGVAAVARTMDPTIRKPEGVVETIESRIPGLSQDLPAQRTVFGEPVTRDPGVIANMLDPTSPTTDVREHDALVRELSRVGAAIGRLKREPEETAEAFEQRQITYGQRLRARLERLVRSPGYQRRPVERQQELIEDTVTELRRQMSRRRHKRASR